MNKMSITFHCGFNPFDECVPGSTANKPASRHYKGIKIFKRRKNTANRTHMLISGHRLLHIS